jgi:hypothetical protein
VARILILGTGEFGALAARELDMLGHQSAMASRRHAGLRADARDVGSVRSAIRSAKADALLLTLGPYVGLAPEAARAAQAEGIPYVDLSDDPEYSKAVHRLGRGVPLLTGMSTAPAMTQALARRALRRAPAAEGVRGALYVGGHNPQGKATLAYAAKSRLPEPSAVIDFPSVGRRRAFPAGAYFDLPDRAVRTRFYVALGGLMGIGWRSRFLTRHAAPLGRFATLLSRDLRGALVAEALDARGAVLAHEGVFLPTDGKRLPVAPALWALEEALAGRAPRRAAFPHEWVDPDALLSFLKSHGFTHEEHP